MYPPTVKFCDECGRQVGAVWCWSQDQGILCPDCAKEYSIGVANSALNDPIAIKIPCITGLARYIIGLTEWGTWYRVLRPYFDPEFAGFLN